MKDRTIRLLAVIFVILSVLVLGCSSDVEIVYNFDAFEMVESALAYKGGSLIAKAERVGMRPVEPTIMDIEVVETYFHPESGEIIYKGKMLFRCRTNIEMGERVKVTPIFGKKPMDLFRKWPYAVSGF